MSSHSRRRLSWGAVPSDDATTTTATAANDDDDDVSESSIASTLSPSQSASAASAATTTATAACGNDNDGAVPHIRYDVHDHTRALPLQPGEQPPRMLIAPAALLRIPLSSSSSSSDDKQGDNTKDNNDDDNGNDDDDDDNGAVVVRLPHPRDGAPALFMCPPLTTTTTVHGDNTSSSNTRDDATSLSVLYELQEQGAPDGFVQSWFVDDVVLPSTRPLLVATPFDVTFLALHALLQQTLHTTQHRNNNSNDDDDDTKTTTLASVASSSCFLPASQLYSATTLSRPHDNDDDDDEDTHTTTRQQQTQQQQQQDWGWRGWPAAVRACGALAPVYAALCAHTTLSKLCDVAYAPASSRDNDDNNDDKNSAETRVAYYRFSPDKAAAWLAHKVARVRACTALHTLLQLPQPSQQQQQQEQQQTTGQRGDDDAASCVVPLRIAFALVMDYVHAAMHDATARACGLPDDDNTNVDDKAACGDDVLLTDRNRGGHTTTTTTTAGVRVTDTCTPRPSRGPVSASVRRLEKAGAPKGVPTLQAMFAKKAAASSSSTSKP